MLDVAKSLPEDPDELRQFTALLLAEVSRSILVINETRYSAVTRLAQTTEYVNFSRVAYKTFH